MTQCFNLLFISCNCKFHIDFIAFLLFQKQQKKIRLRNVLAIQFYFIFSWRLTSAKIYNFKKQLRIQNSRHSVIKLFRDCCDKQEQILHL